MYAWCRCAKVQSYLKLKKNSYSKMPPNLAHISKVKFFLLLLFLQHLIFSHICWCVCVCFTFAFTRYEKDGVDFIEIENKAKKKKNSSQLQMDKNNKCDSLKQMACRLFFIKHNLPFISFIFSIHPFLDVHFILLFYCLFWG